MDRIEKNKKISVSRFATLEKRKNQVCSVYKVKIKEDSLTPQQRVHLRMLFVEAKWIVNDCLQWCEKSSENKPWNYKVGNSVRVKKNDSFETKRLEFLGSQMKQSVVDEIISNIRTLAALKKNGKNVGRLKFRSQVREINLKQAGFTYKFYGPRKIKIQGVPGKVLVNGMEQFYFNPNIEYANAKLLNTPKGYYIAVTTYKQKQTTQTEFLSEIGIDMGCETSITCSTGEKISVQIEEPERLKRLQRKSARQLRIFGKNSHNRQKTKRLIQIEYQKITDQKNDLANKIVHNLLQHEKVWMQDEQLNVWKRNGHGKKVQHSVLGRVKQKLIQNPRVQVLYKFAPTTKSCLCGGIANLALKDRTFVCPVCSHTEDRDIHAAKNMIILGKQYGGDRRNLTPMDSNTAGEVLNDKAKYTGRSRKGRHL